MAQPFNNSPILTFGIWGFMGQLFIKPLESLWWWDLKRVCGGSNEEKLFDKGSRWKIGIGDKARFWVDSWVDENCLANLFPRLYLISEQKQAKV
ncbi:hypothetical protein GmHk_13G037484 [Glycine max]|nr:hypothetical protein GmHk_13G037484 [Glycine max]